MTGNDTVTSVTGYPIEDTSWLSQGVELNSEMLASIAISLKKLADHCGKLQPESEVMSHKPDGQSNVPGDNATAPVMGADPPWFAEQAEAIMQDAHEACGVYHTTAKGQIIRALHRAFEYGKRFVSDQPPSSDRVMTALSTYLSYLGHYSTVVDPAGIEAMRAALIAAAKARSGVTNETPRTDYLTAQGIHTVSPPADENRPKESNS